MTANSFRQLTAFVVSDVSRRRSDKSWHGVLFHIFAHVDTYDIAIVVKERFSQGFGQFCFTYACRAEEDERTDGTIRIFNSCTSTHNSITYDANRFVLADDSLMECIVQMKEFFTFTRHHLCNGNTRPTADNLCNVFFTDFFFQ